MKIGSIAVGQINITVVYEVLDLAALSRDALRAVIPGSAPQLVDLPSSISALYPDHGQMCTIDEHRVSCTDGTNRPVGERGLHVLVCGVTGLVSRSARQLAYGLNYQITALNQDTDDSAGYFTSKFLRGPSRLRAALGASTLALRPRLCFTVPPASYSLDLEPIGERASAFQAHLNVHFASPCLPSPDELQAQLTNQYQFLIRSLAEV